jgi:F-type H+-transporting ATPase subunit a
LNDLAQNLIEELQCETVFTIPILGGIPVSEAVVVTWIIMAVLVVVSFILTRNLKVDHISKRQAVAESIVTGLMKMVQGMVGEKGKAYVPYLTTVMLYIGVSNIIGLFGFKSPTKGGMACGNSDQGRKQGTEEKTKGMCLLPCINGCR